MVVRYMTIIESYLIPGIVDIKLVKHHQVLLKLGTAHPIEIARMLSVKLMIGKIVQQWCAGPTRFHRICDPASTGTGFAIRVAWEIEAFLFSSA